MVCLDAVLEDFSRLRFAGSLELHAPCADRLCACHAGRVETVAETSHRLQFHEQKIGCESCHGPGSLHVNARRKLPKFAGEVDFTIVHPGKLSREVNEAICARCHQRSAAFASVRGRSISQFRPGLPLTDFRIDYKPEQSDDAMTVVGHFEQMRESRCYTESKTMTCTSCHDPHLSMQPAEKIGYYRRKCLSCHESDGGCKLPEKPRLQKSPKNNCMQCHMPKSGTDIPHFAFTHHRIGLKHKLTKPEQQPNSASRLVPMGNLANLLPIDRQRCLGLAEIEYSEKTAEPARSIIRERALMRLERSTAPGFATPRFRCARAIALGARFKLVRAVRRGSPESRGRQCSR